MAGELFEDFGGTGETIAGFADRDVEDEFLGVRLADILTMKSIGGVCVNAYLDLQFPHGVLRFVLAGFCLFLCQGYATEEAVIVHGFYHCEWG